MFRDDIKIEFHTYEEEKELIEEGIKEFWEDITAMVKMGAKCKQTAIKWLYDAWKNSMHGFDFDDLEMWLYQSYTISQFQNKETQQIFDWVYKTLRK